MQTFFMILTSLFLGYACGQLAQKKGRNPNHWFFIGALFGLFALLTLALLPPPKNRRGSKQAPAPQEKNPLLTAIDTSNENKLWYYLDAQQTQFGPMSLQGLTREWQEGKVNAATFVWNETLDQWKSLENVLRIEL